MWGPQETDEGGTRNAPGTLGAARLGTGQEPCTMPDRNPNATGQSFMILETGQEHRMALGRNPLGYWTGIRHAAPSTLTS